MTKNERAVVACVRKDDPFRLQVPGAELEYCPLCNHEIWVSPSSPRDLPHWCIECAMAKFKGYDGPVRFSRPPNVDQELWTAIRDATTTDVAESEAAKKSGLLILMIRRRHGKPMTIDQCEVEFIKIATKHHGDLDAAIRELECQWEWEREQNSTH